MSPVHRFRPFFRCLVALGLTSPAWAHVGYEAPDGGEVLVPGTTHRILWTVVVPHNTENWDVYVSTTGTGGPFTQIGFDIPAGDPTPGSMHFFDWVVPDTPSTDVWIAVVQDNEVRDYYDLNEVALEIGTSASTVVREGVAGNPLCLSSVNAPVLGTDWSVAVDHSAFPGATLTGILGTEQGGFGTFTSFGEVLLDFTSRRLTSLVSPATGTEDIYTSAVPNDLAFLGVQVTLQAVVSEPNGPKLCNSLWASLGT